MLTVQATLLTALDSPSKQQHPQLTLPSKPGARPQPPLRGLERGIAAGETGNGPSPETDQIPPMQLGSASYTWLRRISIVVGLLALIVILFALNYQRSNTWVPPAGRTDVSKDGGPVHAPKESATNAAISREISSGNDGPPPLSPDVDSSASNTAIVARASTGMDDSQGEGQTETPATTTSPDEQGNDDSVKQREDELVSGLLSDPNRTATLADYAAQTEASAPVAETQGIAMPPNTYVYAAARLSIVHDAGVVGVPEGSRLTVLEQRGENLLVSYRGYKGEVIALETRAKP